MKTELVSIVSHELRTPLASVLGFTALLLKREFDPPIRRHYLGIVDAQARRLAALLEDFLDVQRIEHEGSSWRTERVDLAALLDEQARALRGTEPKHTARSCARGATTGRAGRPGPTGQVVGNLLSNAIKYSPDGGTVQLAAERSGDGGTCDRARQGPESPKTSRNGSLRSSSAAMPAQPGSPARPRPRGLARDRRGARRQHRFRQ